MGMQVQQMPARRDRLAFARHLVRPVEGRDHRLDRRLGDDVLVFDLAAELLLERFDVDGHGASLRICRSVTNPAMIRAARPDEIALLPQIENAADKRYARQPGAGQPEGRSPRRCDKPQLLHDCKAIDQVPGFNDLAALVEVVQVPECCLNPAVGRCNAHNGLRVDGNRRAVAHDPIALCNGVLDDDLEVGPAFMHRRQELLDMFASWPHIARSDLMVRSVKAHAASHILCVECRFGFQIVFLVSCCDFTRAQAGHLNVLPFKKHCASAA